MKKIGFAFLYCISVINVLAQDFNSQKLDSFFNALDANKKIMGSVAISKKGKIIYTKSIGFIDENKAINANSNTKYRIGSISKMFTATIIFQLIEEKKITLETTLDKYFKQIPNSDKITIGNMLNHRTGIFNITNDTNYLNWCSNVISQKEMIDKIAVFPSQFEPNTKAEYSNSNFILLTYIIEKITKKSYVENLSKRIINKLSLKNTFYGGKINNANNEAISFDFEIDSFKKFEPETNMSVPLGAGAIISTPSELTLFIEALFAEKLVNKSSLQQMQSITDGMGMGMFSFPFYNHKAFGHTGGIDGFSSNLGYFPKDSLAFSYCLNGSNYNGNDIAIAILNTCFNKKYKIPDFKKSAKNNINLLKYVGIYSSPKFPLKITISSDGKNLFAQATGQSAFALEYSSTDTFVYETANIELIFDVEKEQMILNQSGKQFTLKKEK
ncbi:MAG: serine hydrolase domain-containing protein [Chitinophagaceae bacterium]